MRVEARYVKRKELVQVNVSLSLMPLLNYFSILHQLLFVHVVRVYQQLRRLNCQLHQHLMQIYHQHNYLALMRCVCIWLYLYFILLQSSNDASQLHEQQQATTSQQADSKSTESINYNPGAKIARTDNHRDVHNSTVAVC